MTTCRDFPVVFTKPPSSVVGPEAPIDPHPTVTKELDYEAELAVIIGRGGTDIPGLPRRSSTSGATRSSTTSPPATASATTSSGSSARDSTRSARWGPYAVTADEVTARR